MNRRGLFSLAGGGAALLAASRVKAAPAPVAPVEYDLGGPHAWGNGSVGITDPGHTHSLSMYEMPSHVHSVSFMQNGVLVTGSLHPVYR